MLWAPDIAEFERQGDVRMALRPPVDFEIVYAGEHYLVVIPYTDYAARIRIGDHNPGQSRISGHGGSITPPGAAVTIETDQPAELLLIEIHRNRAESIIQRAAGVRDWIAKPVVDLIDQGLTNLAIEARRSLLADPIKAAPYLEALADAIMARLACKMVGLGLGALPKEGLAPTTVKRVIETIERNLAEKLRIEELAELAGLSRSHFSRAFQATTGHSPQEFLIQRRLCQARSLLSETDLSIGDIA
ncbi:MAG: AraC family transcriptional regulator, partial [Pseudomonadota bacterium]